MHWHRIAYFVLMAPLRSYSLTHSLVVVVVVVVIVVVVVRGRI